MLKANAAMSFEKVTILMMRMGITFEIESRLEASMPTLVARVASLPRPEKL